MNWYQTRKAALRVCDGLTVKECPSAVPLLQKLIGLSVKGDPVRASAKSLAAAHGACGHERTVFRALNALEDRQLIRRDRDVAADGFFASNLIHLNWAALLEMVYETAAAVARRVAQAVQDRGERVAAWAMRLHARKSAERAIFSNEFRYDTASCDTSKDHYSKKGAALSEADRLQLGDRKAALTRFIVSASGPSAALLAAWSDLACLAGQDEADFALQASGVCKEDLL